VPGKEQRIEKSLLSSRRSVPFGSFSWMRLLQKRMKKKKDFFINLFSFVFTQSTLTAGYQNPLFKSFEKKTKREGVPVALDHGLFFFFVYVVSSLSTQYKHPLSSGPD
jgi:hypothetical protein